MRLIYSTLILFFISFAGTAQKRNAYPDSIVAYQKNYTTTHEVVKGNDKKFFRFFPADKKFLVQCRFQRSTDSSVVRMNTSGKTIPQKDYFRYGKLIFKLHDTALQLTVYQSRSLRQNPQYKDYLFIPFTDITTGEETYGSGRYIDILTTDIKNNTVTIDFNKAYNPYCAYSEGYNCPIPPAENYLPVAVKAGEKTFAKPVAH
ncbi:DUF1684 domain-containing protein [Ferruginibacter sp. SUN106]|uniref:DUF1684 domain-containing protein n=1 Tax=Ferruginibacter sp. SUN106 TaxID=2978348 RepID=UPI003D36251C